MLVKYNQKTGEFDQYPLPTDSSGGPFAVQRDTEGNIWFTETISGKIGVINPQTGEIQEFVPEEPMKAPRSIVF